MDLMERHNIRNLCGMFMYEDVELLDFSIKNGCVEYAKEINRAKNKGLYPAEWCVTDSIGYLEINEYFKNHVVEDGAQDLQKYLAAMKMDYYDIDELVKRTNGTSVNRFWIRFNGVGMQKFEDIYTFVPPLIM